MTTVSLVECNTPVSLRTCGSSISSLVHNRKRLQSFSPEKRAAVFKARAPDVRGRFNMSPNHLGLEGALVSSPLQSPIPRSPFSGFQSRLTFVKSSCNSSTSSDSDASDADDFSEEDLDNYKSCNSPDSLYVVGSKPKLHGMYEIHVPKQRSFTPKTKPHLLTKSAPEINQSNIWSALDQDTDEQSDRESSPSPNNPPPSPINFRPSIEGFVVGGKKLSCPDRAKSSINTNYEMRDFNPGYVKQPHYQCVKCEGKVVEEEQTEVALQRKLSSLLTSRASHHRYHTPTPLPDVMTPAPRDVTPRAFESRDIIEQHSQLFLCSPDAFRSYLDSPSSPGPLDKSFIQIYTEKKKEKAKRVKDLQEQQERLREERKMERVLKIREQMKRREVPPRKPSRKIFAIQKENKKPANEESSKNIKSDTNNADAVDTIESRDSKTPPSHSPDTNLLPPISPTNQLTNQIPVNGAISDLSEVQTITTTDHVVPKSAQVGHKADTMGTTVVDKCQVRRCWSDIWPFPDNLDVEFVKRTDSEEGDEVFFSSAGHVRCKNRLTPFHPLPPNNPITPLPSKYVEPSAAESQTSIHDDHLITSPEVPPELQALESSSGGEENDSMSKLDDSEENITMTATVIIPPHNKPCTQWITFNDDNEPIMNNGSSMENGCDTFLKRLQRSKLYANSDPSLPQGQQFCFEAMVDKRYNRWKRRRRKKKESEFQRSTVPPSSDSSDDNEDSGDRQLERIIDRMYDQMNGTPPQTPGGSRDTPRLRNRRRRKDNVDDQTNFPCRSKGSGSSYYDASSEWTSSDKDGSAMLSSSSGAMQYGGLLSRERPNKSTSGTNSDDLCTWPYLEQYKQEIMKRIQNTSQEQLDTMNQREWLPDITNPGHGTNTKYKASDEGTENEAGAQGTVDQLSVRIHDRSDSSSSIRSSSTQGSKKLLPSRQIDHTEYSKWSRSQPNSRKKIINDKPKLLARTSVVNRSEMGLSPGPVNCVGVVAVGEASDDNTFEASVRPIKRSETGTPTGSKQARKIPKEPSQTRRTSVNLPTLSKNIKAQTLPNKRTNKQDKSSKASLRTNNFKDTITRPKTQPQVTTKKNHTGYGGQAASDFLFRDYYLRSLYTKSKTRVNSHVDSFNRGADNRIKRTLTVDTLELGSRKPQRKPESDGKVSDLSFTRSFTFSMFDLPEMHKLYNARLERRANGQESPDSDA